MKFEGLYSTRKDTLIPFRIAVKRLIVSIQKKDKYIKIKYNQNTDQKTIGITILFVHFLKNESVF
jgi:hypothetical protein